MANPLLDAWNAQKSGGQDDNPLLTAWRAEGSQAVDRIMSTPFPRSQAEARAQEDARAAEEYRANNPIFMPKGTTIGDFAAEAGRYVVEKVKARARTGEAQRDAAQNDGFLDRAGSLLEAGTASAIGGLQRAATTILAPVVPEQNLKRVRRDVRAVEDVGNMDVAGSVGDLRDIKSASDVGSFIIDQAFRSAPEMAITAIPGIGLATEGVIMTGRLGQQRAQNNGREDATIGDLAKAAPAAAASAYLEKLGIEKIFGPAGKTVAGRIGQATAGEALTEFAQEGVEYAGSNLGTDVGFDPKEAFWQAAGGAVAGAGMGAGIRGGVEAVDATGRIANRRADDTRTPGAGVRETAEAAAANVTQSDLDSPLDTADIVAGRAEQVKARAGSVVDAMLQAGGLPAVGKRVVVDLGDGNTQTGTMRDVFEADDGSGVVIDLDSGKTLREYTDTLADAGVTISEAPSRTAEADAIDAALAEQALQQDAAGAAETGSDSPAQGDVQPTAPPSQRGRSGPVADGGAVIRSIFGDKARVTSTFRGKDHPLTRANPKSWHSKSHAAVDMAPIPGVSFDEAKAAIEAKGYHLIEALNEVGKGRTKHATGDHWHFVIGEGRGGGGEAASAPAVAAPATVTPPPDIAFTKPDFEEAVTTPTERREDAADTVETAGADMRGEPINEDWVKFAADSGTLDIPRSEMPQIKAEHRGAMVNFMNARGIDHAEEIVDPASLKPSQTEFSPDKVQKAKDFTGGNRAILISSDGHVVDGHHQWLAARDRGEEIRAIRLNAPIREVLAAAHDFPSSTVDENSTDSGDSRNTDTAFQASSPNLSTGGVAASPALSETAGGHVAQVDAAPDAPAPVAVSRTGRPAIAAAPQATDTRDVAITTSGREVPVRYAVVSADDLITSHSSDGRINPDFPAALQPRDRARGTSQAQIAEIAAKLDPRLLGRSVKAADGAPIISPDGIVESGNGRTLALLRAYRQGSGRIAAYQKFLRDEGFDTAGIRRPVLVRIREGDMSDADVEAFTREANQRDTAGFSATEQAASDSAALPANVLDLYRGGDIDAAGNREFVRRFIASVVPTTEQAGMIAADGAMSQDAVRRIGAALLQRAYGNANLVARVSEATDSNIKAIGGALSDVSANWAKMVAAAKDGRIDPAMDITEHLNAAVELVDRARREGVKVADLVNQRDIFSGDVVAAHTEAVLRLMFRNQALTQPVSRQKLAAKLSWYVDQAMLSTADAGLFGTAEKTTPDEVIGLAQEKFGEQPSGQDDLLAAARPRDAGDGDGVRQGGRAGNRDGEALSREAGDEGRAQSERVKADEPGPAPAPIDDFGEKLEGARKDVWQAYADRLRSAHNEDVQSVPLSKSWPEPDYQKLIDEGADPYVVASMRAMRDAVPTKPRSYGVVAWSKQVEALRAYAEGLLNGSIDAESQRRKLIGEFSRSLRDLQGSIDLYATFGHERSFKGITFGENHYSVYRGERNVTKWAIEQKAKATAFSNWPRELAIADTREEVLAKFRAALAGGVLDPKKRNDVVRFDIYSRKGQPGFWIGKKIGKEFADLKRFDTAKEARDFKISDEGYAELVAALDRFKDIPPERKAVNSPRIGVNHRNGADVTPEQFAESFGFRGVQFGNYVEGARRQADLNEAYDALMDLAGVLGVPAKALSLNGSLGLAFGARGKGGKNAASAHYETDNVVINLTKKAGAGSLAHEWWHSLDNYFSRMRNDPTAYLSDKPYERGNGVRPEMVQAFKGVMDAIRSTELRQRSSNLDKRRTKAYWSTDIEMSARAFESYVIAKLQDEQFSNDYLANIVPEQSFGIEAGYPYPTAAEVASIRAGFDTFFQTIETRETDTGTALYSIPDLPTVAVRVADWGKLPASGRSRLNVLRGRFIRWYEGLIGTTVTSSDGRPVRFNATGLKKAMRTGDGLLTIGRAIPKIIERGKLVGSEPSRRPGMKAAHRYAANVRDENGNLRAAVVLVREADDGTFHYSLHDYVSEGARDASVETDREAKMAFAPALEGNARDEINLVLLDADSNADVAVADLSDLQARLESYGIARKVAVRLVDTLNGAAGSYQNRLIQIAADTAQDGAFTLDHEAIHALRDLGLFNNSEWAILAAKAKRDPGLMRSIRQRYPRLGSEARVEEAVADMFARYQRGDYKAEGTVARLFRALRQALEAIGNALAGRGLRTAEGVLDDVAGGDVGVEASSGDAEKFSIPERADMVDLSDADPTWRGKMADAFDAWRTRMQDRYLPLLKVQRDIERATGAPLPEGLNPYLGEELMSGRIGARLEALTDDHVGPLFDAMHEAGVSIDEMESYLYARHAPERNARIAEINPGMAGNGSGMTDLEARAIMNRIRNAGKMETMERLAARVDTIRDMALDYRVETGLMSQEQADEWRATYQSYIPLRGFAEVDGDPGAADRINRSGGGINVRGKESKSAFGRRSKADSPLAYTILQAEEAIVRGETNRVAQRFVKLAEANPDGDFWEVNKVTHDRRLNEETGLVENVTNNLLTAADKDWTVSAKFDGVERRVTMNRDNASARRLADAMRNLTQHQLDFVTKYLGAVNRFLSSVNTSWNPEFVITNAFRDLQAAAINLNGVDVDGIAGKVLKSYAGALRGAMKGAFGRTDGDWGKWYNDFLLDGGRVYFNHVEDVGLLKKRIESTMAMKAAKPGDLRLQARRVLVGVRDTIENVNMGVENAIRLATYRAARESGVSRDKAASLAKNVTVNFNRRGTFGPAMNAAYMFYNASMQGTVRILQATKSPRVRKMLAGVVVSGFLLEMLNAMVSGDDDDGESFYDKLSDFDKSRNMIVPLGGDQFLKIPMPYGYNVFFNAGRSLAEVARRGGDRWQESAGNFVSSVADAFNPVGGTESLLNFIFPTIGDPIVDLERNRDFAGRPIMPEQPAYGPPEPDHQRYWGTGPTFWKAITDTLSDVTGGDDVQPGAIDVSPETLDYLAGTALGAAGAFANRVLDLGGKVLSGDEVTANDLPLIRKLAGGKPGWYDKAAYYDRLNQVAQQVDYAKGYIEAEDMEGARAFVDANEAVLSLERDAKQARKDMRDVRKAKRANEAAHDKGLIDENAYEAERDVIAEAEKLVIQRFNTAWNAAHTAGE